MADRLGDERRANGARIEKERRSYDNGAARRANGDRIARERTGADVQEDINSLVRPVVTRKQLSTVPPLGVLPLKRGRADYKAPANATGGGIASPLTEGSASTREYFDQQLLPTTDGIVWIRWKSVKKITMADANDAEVILEFKNGV